MKARRQRLLVDGVVQGVGFRPFVYQLARHEALTGFVTNTSEGVVIEIEGHPDALDRFTRRLGDEAPALARLLAIAAEDMPLAGDPDFVIRPSHHTPGTRTLIPPDVATCADCRREIRDPGDRRHGYPFTNCTNCGPRWTIVGRIPYDRPWTSMAVFPMCDICQREYDDPADRRFHAQPNACPACGPRLWLVDPAATCSDGELPIPAAAKILADGRILAIKGLGGFHLAVRADQEAAVDRLRQRKQRETKPLAVMVADLAVARRLVHLAPAAEALLSSPAAPIVLMTARPEARAAIAAAVAPGHRRLGCMLPYTPLHHLLMAALCELGIEAVVLTSGNAGQEPICLDNREAQSRLADIADAWLLHDRDILRRADDSVVQIVGARPLLHRRSRGHAPLPIALATGTETSVLALGGDLKNVVGLLKDDRIFLSPHVGDLENRQAHDFFLATIANLQQLLECKPAVIAHDLHPGYFGTRWAHGPINRERRLVPVQHHHAHLAAVLAEHQHPGPAIGLILDGTGYGPDGTIWGGEILVGDAAGYRRAGHLERVPLPGGDAAIRSPWRTAVAFLRHACGDDPSRWPRLAWLAEHPVGTVLEILRQRINSPLTSSCGRLFDAVAAMTGRWAESGYEAQAAMEFMALADPAQLAKADVWPDAMSADDLDREPLVIPLGGLVRATAEAVAAGVSPAEISARFHRTLAGMLVAAVVRISRATGLQDVVLAGGVFQNELLLEEVEEALSAASLQPLRPQLLPPGDGALAVGQAVVAARSVG